MFAIGKAVKPIKKLEQELKYINHLEYRDKRVYIYWVIARSGSFRSTEVLNLTVGDIKRVLKKGYFDFTEKKTGKNRSLPIQNDIADILRIYIQGKADYEVLMPSSKGVNQPLTYRQMQRLIKKYGLECGIKGIGSHTPRKTAAYHLFMETGGDIQEVKKLLGHDNLRDSYAYIDAIEESKLFRVKMTKNPFIKRNKVV